MSDDASTTSHPALAMIEHGNSRIDTARTDGITKAYDGLSVLMALVQAGKIPGRFLVGLGEWSEQVAAAVDNGDPIPSLGAGGDSGIKPEYRALIRALDNGTIELDSRGLPKKEDADNTELDDALKQLDTALGHTSVMSDPKMRLDGIVESIKELKKNNATDVVDEFGDGLNVKRNTRESDQDYKQRIISEVKATFSTLLNGIGDAAGLKRNSGESDKDYKQRIMEGLDGKLMELVDLIAEAAKVNRKSGESDQDYAERVATTVVNLRGWTDASHEVNELVKNKLGRERRNDEAFVDYVSEATGSSGGIGGFSFKRGSRG